MNPVSIAMQSPRSWLGISEKNIFKINLINIYIIDFTAQKRLHKNWQMMEQIA